MKTSLFTISKVQVLMFHLSWLIVEPGGDNVQGVYDHGHYEPGEESPGQIGQPGAAREARVTAHHVINVPETCTCTFIYIY